MRTTVTLDDETHNYASYYAEARGLTLSAAIDELIQKARNAQSEPSGEIQYSPSGLPVFAPHGGTITAESVKKIEGEEFDPQAFA